MYKVFNEESFLKSRSYIMRIYSAELKRGRKYYEISKVTQINFVDDVKIEINDDIKSTYYFGPESISKEVSMDIVQLDKVRELVYNENDRFIKYLKFIGAKSKEEREIIAKGDEILMEMDNFLDFYTNDKEIDEFFRTYNRDYWNERIYREDGRQKGAKESKIEIAKKLLEKNETDKCVSEITGLSIKEIDQIKNES